MTESRARKTEKRYVYVCIRNELQRDWMTKKMTECDLTQNFEDTKGVGVVIVAT